MLSCMGWRFGLSARLAEGHCAGLNIALHARQADVAKTPTAFDLLEPHYL